MSPQVLLEQLHEMGVEVIPEGDRLRLRAPKGVLTPEVQRAISEQKPEILRCLTRMARVRGTDRVEPSYPADICWHCHGKKECNCAGCGDGVPGSWKAGQCGGCRGTGLLCWGKVN